MSASLYRAYKLDRQGNYFTKEPEKSHAQIVADGVYGDLVESFGLRYSLEIAAHADALIQRDKLNGWITPGPHHDRSTDGRPLE